jgi:uncharacterized protein
MFDVFLKDNAEYLMYLVALVVSAFLYFLASKKLNFSIRVLTAMVLGVAAGFIFKDNAMHLNVLGRIYRNLIQVIVIPLITVSIIKSLTQLEDKNALKNIGLKSIFWLLITTAIGAALGIFASVVTKLGSGFSLPIGENKNQTFKLVDALLNLVPRNVVQNAANGDVIQVIFFAVLVSIAVIMEGSRHPERVKPFKDFVNSAADVMGRVTKLVIRFTPYGVFGLVANATARNNPEAFKDLALYVGLIYGVMIFHFIVVQLGLIAFVGKLNPIQFVKKVYPAQLVGLTTQSSYGTLPVTIKSLNRAGVSERISNFTAPLGANMGMNACAGIYPAMVAIFTANATGFELTMTHYITIIITCVVASIGIAGVPGIASVVATVVLASVGLPLEGLLLVVGVEAFVDMGRTALNITGTTVAATLVARSEKELDLEKFNSDIPADAEMTE